MVTVKGLVRSLVHDTNAPLGTIRQYVSLIKDNIDDKETVLRYLNTINDAVKRGLLAVDNLYTELENSKLWEEHL